MAPAPVLACPQGHVSDDPDWCDVCGLALAPTSNPAVAVAASAQDGPRDCAACGARLEARFCETCGHDSQAPVAPPPPHVTPSGGSPTGSGPAAPGTPSRTWWAVVRADRVWFEEVRRTGGPDTAALQFPGYSPERRFALAGPHVMIGRRSTSRGTAPDLDLGPLDPGVSAAHAMLVARADGGWDVVDVGSTNGTTLAVADGPLPPHRPVPAPEGTVIHLGAWTTITLTATPA